MKKEKLSADAKKENISTKVYKGSKVESFSPYENSYTNTKEGKYKSSIMEEIIEDLFTFSKF